MVVAESTLNCLRGCGRSSARKGPALSKPSNRSVARVFEVLGAIGDLGGGVSTSALVTKCQFPRSTIHSVLSELEAQSCVTYDPVGRTWSLGVRLLQLGTAFLRGQPIEVIGRPRLLDLAERTGCTAHIAILDGGDVVYLAKEHPQSGSPVRLVTEVGIRLPAHLTAVGQAMLAALPMARVRDLFRDVKLPLRTGSGASDLDELMSRLNEVQALGYAEEIGQTTTGVACTAAAVFDASGSVAGAIGISRIVGAGDSAGPASKADYAIPVMNSAESLSQDLGQVADTYGT